MKHDNNIDNYFSRVKQNPPLIPIEKVHQIISRPETKARLKGKNKNLLKFTIMTTIFAAILSAVLLWTNNKAEEFSRKEITKIQTQSYEGFTFQHKDKSEEERVLPEKEDQQNVSRNEINSKKTDQIIDPNSYLVKNSNTLEDLDANTISKKNAATYNDSIVKNNPSYGKQTNAENRKNYSYPEHILDSTMFIELTRDELENLGFSLKDKYMQLQFFQGNELVNISYFDNDISFGFYIDDYERKDSSIINYKAKRVLFGFDETKYECVIEDIYPMLITNEDGEKMLKISMPEDKLKVLFSEMYNKDFRTLLPVVIRENTFGIQPIEDIVFWFLPTDNFFNRLPKNIREKLLGEYNYITAEDKSTLEKPECKYFEECKNTLKVANFKIYPNPASTNATVSFTLNEAIIGRITLVDLAGREKQVLQPNTNYSKGSHQFDVDVSNVPEGIYLLTLYSNKGVQTQRFVVTM